jgi:phospholipid/cholesterol/gamma-HCH transport system permease protein
VTASIAALGRRATDAVAWVGALARFCVATLDAVRSIPRAGRRVTVRVLLDQIRFTALQAIPFVILLAGILSFLVISQAVLELGRLGATELIGRLMVVVIVRELGPLLTALAVVGRSGTAIAAELATNKALGEIRALEGIGIDPLQYLVVPRLAGVLLSVLGLVVLFDLVAIGAGLLAAMANGMSGARYAEIVLDSLSLRDTWLTPVKALVFGAIIGVVPSFQGLTVGGPPTAVPVAAREAVVASIAAIFICAGLFVVVL